jgi:hypothetical protein
MNIVTGLALNVLVWLLMAVVLAGTVLWAVVEMFPGAARRTKAESRTADARRTPESEPVEDREAPPDYRKAS